MSAQKMANLQAILRWSLNETAKEIAREKEKEQERAASAASGEDCSAAGDAESISVRKPKMMSEERRNFLMEAMASMTEDTAQILEDAGAVHLGRVLLRHFIVVVRQSGGDTSGSDALGRALTEHVDLAAPKNNTKPV